MKGVILAAGKGTRMRPLTCRRPKPLVPVVDRPLVEHIMIGARDAGVTEIALVIGHLGEQIIQRFGDGRGLGLALHYIWQEEIGGTGAAVLLTQGFVGQEPFFLSWGDIIVPPRSYDKVVGAYQPGRTAGVLSLNWVDDPHEGAAVYVKDGLVERIEEKPPKGTATTHYNNAGLFVFGPELFDYLRRVKPSPRGEVELPTAVQEMIRAGHSICAVELDRDGYWSDVARPSAVLAVNRQIMEDRYGTGGVYVHPQARVSADSELVGPAYIGPACVIEGAKVGPNVALMGSNEIGEGARFEEAAMFTGARAGGRTRVRHCLLEEGACLGEGEEVVGDRLNPRIVSEHHTATVPRA